MVAPTPPRYPLTVWARRWSLPSRASEQAKHTGSSRAISSPDLILLTAIPSRELSTAPVNTAM